MLFACQESEARLRTGVVSASRAQVLHPQPWAPQSLTMIRRVARLSRNVGQSDHILANPIIGHKAEWRPGSGEIWLAVTKHDGVQVDSILIDQAKSGPATSISPSRSAFSLRIAPSRSSSTSLALGPTDFNERETTHFGWFRHAAAKACSSASHSG